ncbi:MAG TPA: phosphodiester glycosidase family protein [Gaiellaceae bacterium]
MAEIPLTWRGVSLLRRVLIVALLAFTFAPPAGAATQTLLPGLTYTRQLLFTPHGPVVEHVLVAPRPGGLWSLDPTLSDGAISGRQRLTGIERQASAAATVAGVNGDYFNAADGRPDGILMQNRVLQSVPNSERSSVGIEPNGSLDIRHAAWNAFWQGRGQRRPLTGLNEPANQGGITLYTPAWGAATPPAAGATEAVIFPFPALTPGNDLSGNVVQFTQGGNTPIPAGGAVLSATGGSAQKLDAEAPPGARVTIRYLLSSGWATDLDAIGGGPLLVRNGKAVFRAFEDFSATILAPRVARTAICQRRNGSIVLVVADGGQVGYSVGLTNYELAQQLVRLGCVTGAGLEPGASSAMAFDGQLLNRPSDPTGERAVSEGLLVSYAGVYAPAPSDPVLSPNGDGAGDKELLSFKVVRPSTVTAKIVGPDAVARLTQSGSQAPGTYKFTFGGTKPNGAVDSEGRWHWNVTAVDDLGRQSSVDQPFFLNNTLGNLRVPRVVRVGARRRAVIATFKLTRPAKVTTTVESTNGVVVRKVGTASIGAGTASVRWDGRDRRRNLVYGGRYVLRVRAKNQLGPSSLTQTFLAHR